MARSRRPCAFNAAQIPAAPRPVSRACSRPVSARKRLMAALAETIVRRDKSHVLSYKRQITSYKSKVKGVRHKDFNLLTIWTICHRIVGRKAGRSRRLPKIVRREAQEESPDCSKNGGNRRGNC